MSWLADMRLLVLTDQWSPDVVGGSARVATDTARLLAGRGHRVTVIAPAQPGLAAVETLDGIELRRVVRRGLVPQTWGDVAEAWRLTRGDLSSFDVVLAHQATNATGVALQRFEVPLAFVFHASAPLEQRLLRRRLSPMRRLGRLMLEPSFMLLERVAVRAADRILVLSEFSRDLLLRSHEAAGNRAVLVSGGVDVTRFVPLSRAARDAVRAEIGAPVDSPLLLTVRRLEPRMGLEQLLHAVHLLIEAGADFTLAIAGDGMLAGRLRELVAALGLRDRVRLLGRVSEERLPRLYGSADLFVLPTAAYEGFGVSTVEALASGCPVVGTAAGATPELLADLEPRLIARRSTPRDLAETIGWALEHVDVGLRDRCVEHSHRRFDWKRVIDRWEAALLSTISVGKNGPSSGD